MGHLVHTGLFHPSKFFSFKWQERNSLGLQISLIFSECCSVSDVAVSTCCILVGKKNQTHVPVPIELLSSCSFQEIWLPRDRAPESYTQKHSSLEPFEKQVLPGFVMK